MKKTLLILAACFVILLVIVLWPKVATPVVSTSTPTQALPASAYRTVPVVMSGATFNAEIADTPALQELGLSYRTSLAADNAMLFVFPKPTNLKFWMKDMNFPLDIIWLDSNKKVIYIEQNLSPSTYPNGYGPSEDSQYVVEVAAGTVMRIGLHTGDQIIFSCDNYFCMR